MTGAPQDSSCRRLKRKDVTRLAKILWGGLRIAQHLDRGRPIAGADACRCAVGGINGDGEVGCMNFPVVCNHPLESEFGRAFLGNGGTDEPPPKACHEVDCLRCDLGSGHQEISFIFPIFIVRDDDHSALPNLLENHRNGIERLRMFRGVFASAARRGACWFLLKVLLHAGAFSGVLMVWSVTLRRAIHPPPITRSPS